MIPNTKIMKNAELTLIIQQDENGWLIGQIEEFPAAISQGKTLEELQKNLVEALHLLLETQKDELAQEYTHAKIRKQVFQFSA